MGQARQRLVYILPGPETGPSWPHSFAQEDHPFPPYPEWQFCPWEQMPQSPNVINQTNRVYGSRRELLNPAWQLINELIRLCGERGAGLPAQL